MAHQDAVRVTSFLGLSREQFRRRVPPQRHTRSDPGVEGLKASTLGALLLAELVGTVAEHDTLVVADARFGPVAGVDIASVQARARLADLLRHFDLI